MTIHRTVGVGGDHINLSAAWDFLNLNSPLIDDYRFRIISNTVDAGFNLNNIDFNSHTVEFYVEWSESHQGNPVGGFICTVNATAAGTIWRCGTTNLLFNVDLNDVIQFTNINFYRTDAWISNLLVCGALNVPGGMTIIIKNCIFIRTAVPSQGGRCIAIGQDRDAAYISNCKIYNYDRGLNDNFVAAGGPISEHIIENCTFDGRDTDIWGCNYGLQLAVSNWIIRNVVAILYKTADFAPMNAGVNIYNSADSDNSLVTTSNAILHNCRPNIVPADEFQSLDIADDNWLKLKEGSASLGAVSSPDKGKAPLKVDFNADVLFQDYAPNLGKSGTAPQISGNNEDMAGKPRPGYDDVYSIGAHEQQYSNFPEE